jgi:dCMP deaminase
MATTLIEPSRQARRDRYYMHLAEAVRTGANCSGTKVGAVIVLGADDALGQRVVSTGYNGTPSGFENCCDGGCVRCARREVGLVKSGEGLDWCICVHAEQNALLTASRFGISVDGGTLYTTAAPCFGCLKETIQAGLARVVYDDDYPHQADAEVEAQYTDLAARIIFDRLT